MSTPLRTTLIRTPVPGGIVDLTAIRYGAGEKHYCLGFVTLGSDGIATRDSVVSTHTDEDRARRAHDRLVEHFVHVSLDTIRRTTNPERTPA